MEGMNEDPGVEETMTFTKRIGLFALTVIIGLALLGSIQWVKQGVDQEFFCSGVNYTVVNFGFFIGSVISILLTGFIASLVFRDTFQSRKDLIVVSACSSCAAGFVWLFTLYFLSVYTEFQNRHYISGSMFRDLVVVSLTHVFWSGLFAFLILLGIMGMGIMGSLIFSCIVDPPKDSLSIAKSRRTTGARSIVVIFVLITGIVLSISLPLVFGIATTSSIASPYSFCAAGSPVTMDITRTDATTITLRISRDDSGRRLAGMIPVTSRPLQIFIDDRDFSNQSLIREMGLTDSINPPEGITAYADGSTVVLSGPEIAGNGSSGCHVYVVSYFDSEHPIVVVDTNR
jgi:hypothetical protein